MTNQQLLTIIISLGGLTLTVTVALAGLILAQSRAVRSELRDIRNWHFPPSLPLNEGD